MMFTNRDWYVTILLIACLIASGASLLKLRSTYALLAQRPPVSEPCGVTPPAPMPIACPMPVVAIPKPTPTMIEDVFNPESASDDVRARLDALKKNTEAILVTHLYLKRCGIAAESDFHILMSGLAREMASINAPGRLQHDILTAAKGSYMEIYAKTECSNANIESLLLGYRDYLQAVSGAYDLP